MKDARVWTAIVGLGLAAWLIGSFMIQPRAPEVSNESIPTIRYVCRESGEVFALPMTGDALDNPKTGRATLVPAVYDARQRKWKPGPPLDVMRRRGLLKPAS